MLIFLNLLLIHLQNSFHILILYLFYILLFKNIVEHALYKVLIFLLFNILLCICIRLLFYYLLLCWLSILNWIYIDVDCFWEWVLLIYWIILSCLFYFLTKKWFLFLWFARLHFYYINWYIINQYFNLVNLCQYLISIYLYFNKLNHCCFVCY